MIIFNVFLMLKISVLTYQVINLMEFDFSKTHQVLKLTCQVSKF